MNELREGAHTACWQYAWLNVTPLAASLFKLGVQSRAAGVSVRRSSTMRYRRFFAPPGGDGGDGGVDTPDDAPGTSVRVLHPTPRSKLHSCVSFGPT
jgi:hypothetical protein